MYPTVNDHPIAVCKKENTVKNNFLKRREQTRIEQFHTAHFFHHESIGGWTVQIYVRLLTGVLRPVSLN